MLTEVLTYRSFIVLCQVKFVKTSNCLQLLSTEAFAATVAQSAYGNPTRATELGLKSADGEWEVIWETVFSVLSGSEV